VVGGERSILERLAVVIDDDTGRDEALDRPASRSWTTQRGSDLLVRAESGTRDIVRSLARSLGYPHVTVTFVTVDRPPTGMEASRRGSGRPRSCACRTATWLS
jgi:hypothetical protein